MADTHDWWLLLPQPVRRLPADLAAVILLVGVTILAVFVPVVSETPLRVVVGLPFVLFVPGYAFIAALFPEAGASPTTTDAEEETDADAATEGDAHTDTGTAAGTDADSAAMGGQLRQRGIDGIERIALSFGLSIAIVPLIGLVLNFTPWGIRLVPIMLSVSLFTVGSVAVAARRRWMLPAAERFRVPYRDWFEAGRDELFNPADRTDAVLNVLLVVSIILATASVAYAVGVPKQGESFTELYILTEQDDGELVAAEYPTNFTVGESREVVIGISNQEHEPTNYTTVVQLERGERIRTGNNTTFRVSERQELDRLQTQLTHNGTWRHPYTITPRMTGTDMRLAFLVYRGSPPAEPTVENAYRVNHLWINVTAATAN